MKIIKTNEKGITLIALVITIIVLLILAGITIATLTGENGLFARTKESKKSYIGAEMKEALIMALQDLQAEKLAEATLDNITQEWANDKLAQYKPIVGISTKPSGKTITMEKSGITKTFLIDGNLNIIEVENETNILFSYEIISKDGENVKILIKVQERINGINRVELPDGSTLNCDGTKEEKEIEYTVKIGTEYKFKIIAEDGTSREETILIEPEIQVTEAYIGTSTTETNANNSVADNSQTKGTTLYINFKATIVGVDCTVTLKDDESKTLPYEVTQNGKYIFIVKGEYKGKTYTKEIEVNVNKYQAPKGVVKYDAGDWTKEEIEELKSKKLYMLNAERELNDIFNLRDEKGLNFTFGGFSYANSIDLSKKGIIVDRNKSTYSNGGTPKYDGWRVFEEEEKNGKKYIKKLIHSGTPENFMYCNRDIGPNGAEYLLSNGTRKQEYNTLKDKIQINTRNFDMYKDKDLDKKGYIKEVHLLTYDEVNNNLDKKDIFNIGCLYWLANVRDYSTLYIVNNGGNIDGSSYNNYGIRPVITMADGVYIASGEGTDTSPYILGKE